MTLFITIIGWIKYQGWVLGKGFQWNLIIHTFRDSRQNELSMVLSHKNGWMVSWPQKYIIYTAPKQHPSYILHSADITWRWHNMEMPRLPSSGSASIKTRYFTMKKVIVSNLFFMTWLFYYCGAAIATTAQSTSLSPFQLSSKSSVNQMVDCKICCNTAPSKNWPVIWPALG